jgi:acetyl esterase/lipase
MPDAPRPPFDPELLPVLDAFAQLIPPTITADMIPALRAAQTLSAEAVIGDRAIVHREVTLPGHEGAEITASVFARADHVDAGPLILHIHGGGMVMGDRFSGMPLTLDWVEEFDAVCVSVEYRLAPEHPDPYPVEDCYAALVWTAAHASELGADPSRIVVAGGSAGGGLAAGVSLLARDRGGPHLTGSLLAYPMLDDRDATVSTRQFEGVGVWDRASNDMGWTALLGSRRGTDAVSIYAAPARARDLSGLPPTFLDAGSAEVFRDEVVAYASAIWAAGGVAELHVVPGGFHAFENVSPGARLTAQVAANRRAWLDRVLRPRSADAGSGAVPPAPVSAP